MEKYEETMLDYEPEEEANETPSGAEETELRFGDQALLTPEHHGSPDPKGSLHLWKTFLLH